MRGPQYAQAGAEGAEEVAAAAPPPLPAKIRARHHTGPAIASTPKVSRAPTKEKLSRGPDGRVPPAASDSIRGVIAYPSAVPNASGVWRSSPSSYAASYHSAKQRQTELPAGRELKA